MSVKAVVFKTGARKYEEVLLEKKGGSCLKSLNALVGGSITLIPHKKGHKGGWVAYANDDGMTMNLPSNYLAFGVLHFLGFYGATIIPGAHFGNIVLCKCRGGNEVSMQEADLEAVAAAYEKYRKEMEDEDEEEEAEVEIKEPPVPKEEKEVETKELPAPAPVAKPEAKKMTKKRPAPAPAAEPAAKKMKKDQK
jgi:hypothetical protein